MSFEHACADANIVLFLILPHAKNTMVASSAKAGHLSNVDFYRCSDLVARTITAMRIELKKSPLEIQQFQTSLKKLYRINANAVQSRQWGCLPICVNCDVLCMVGYMTRENE